MTEFYCHIDDPWEFYDLSPSHCKCEDCKCGDPTPIKYTPEKPQELLNMGASVPYKICEYCKDCGCNK